MERPRIALASLALTVCACGMGSGTQSLSQPATIDALSAPPASMPSPPLAIASSPPQASPSAELPQAVAVQDDAEQRAKERVEQIPEYKRLIALGSNLTDMKTERACAQPGCDVRVTVEVQSEVYYVFHVRQDGTTAVQTVGGTIVPYDAWSVQARPELTALEMAVARLTTRIAKLPEIVAYGRRAAAQGGGLIIWLEQLPPRDCPASNRSCEFEFYVGEARSTHATRWVTFRVARHGEAMSVTTLTEIDPIPYAKWRRQKHD